MRQKRHLTYRRCAGTGSEGGANIATMRWAQTANYGTVPNALMPGPTFLAQAYDLGEPWGPTCYEKRCCENATQCAIEGGDFKLCENACYGNGTSSLMGGIHPASLSISQLKLPTRANYRLIAGKSVH